MNRGIPNCIAHSELADLYGRVHQGERLTFEDGVRLFESNDLLTIGYLANIVRERLNGDRAYFIRNQHLNYTNVCVNRCAFCAFSRDLGEEGSYTMSLEEVRARVADRMQDPISEIHIVGGLNPELPYSYYLDMLTMIREMRPEVHLQAFTAVEVAFIAEQGGRSVAEALEELKRAGLGSFPGGGAEVFSDRVRRALCPKKLSSDGWLETSMIAHRLGIRSNATMLYGHMETMEERVEHVIRLRNAQDETGGFVAFIPLAFHPEHTKLADRPGTTGFDDLKNLAVARLMLDNIPHIKAFWIMIGPKLTQISLAFGADDVNGTVTEERITHAAGARTPQAVAREELVRMIREAGRTPVERDTLYNILGS